MTSRSGLSSEEREAFRRLALGLPGLDREAYDTAGRDPLEPLIGLGNPDAPLCFIGRDPGRREVLQGMPFVGSGGQLLRRGLYRHLHGHDAATAAELLALTPRYFWLNTVPYKPLGNKAWPQAVRRRFHPLLLTLLADRWHGEEVITLGREAFLWFGIGQSRDLRAELKAFWARPDRFERQLPVDLQLGERIRHVRLAPLPHPSPLNRLWLARFPDLLAKRLERLQPRV